MSSQNDCPHTSMESIAKELEVLKIPRKVVDKGFLECSMWATTKLMYLANKLGREGYFITSTKTVVTPDDPVFEQSILVFGVEVSKTPTPAAFSSRYLN